MIRFITLINLILLTQSFASEVNLWSNPGCIGSSNSNFTFNSKTTGCTTTTIDGFGTAKIICSLSNTNSHWNASVWVSECSTIAYNIIGNDSLCLNTSYLFSMEVDCSDYTSGGNTILSGSILQFITLLSTIVWLIHH